MVLTPRIGILWCILCALTAQGASAQGAYQSMNGLALSLDKDQEEYTFWVAGHVYGSSSSSPFPAASLLANLDVLNSSGAKFMILAGDALQEPVERHFEVFKKYFLDKILFPVFNAPGNHDGADRKLYENYFGKTFSSFQYSTEMFLILNSELVDGEEGRGQKKFVLDMINEFRRSDRRKHLFIVTHRLLWAIDNPPYDQILTYVNSPIAHSTDSFEFSRQIIPELEKLPNDKKVYFVGGDIGKDNSLTVFYGADAKERMIFLATGIGDAGNDAILKVNVSSEQGIRVTPVSLTGLTMKPIEFYDLEYWASELGSSFDVKKQKANKMWNHLYFKRGLVIAFVGTCFLFVMLRWKRIL